MQHSVLLFLYKQKFINSLEMSMKLIGNRNNPNCIHQMQWNNKMDLIALAHETGKDNFKYKLI